MFDNVPGIIQAKQPSCKELDFRRKYLSDKWDRD